MNIYEMKEEELSKFVFKNLYDNIDKARIYSTRGNGKWAVFKVKNISFEVFANSSFATYCGEPMAGPFEDTRFKIKQGLFGNWIEYQNDSHYLDIPYLNNKWMNGICELMLTKLKIRAEDSPSLGINKLKALVNASNKYLKSKI